uniref:Uncharacterized protein n=1 Tax=Rhizophora mucronata TaxID=61149 RepID=A0A2P2PL82_RHIMU
MEKPEPGSFKLIALSNAEYVSTKSCMRVPSDGNKA